MRHVSWSVAALLLAACATIAAPSFDALFGPARPTRFDVPTEPDAGQSYAQTIQPILDRRCVVCHACYDAPCQLKTTSWEGIVRGASKTPVYNATRLLADPPSRLYEDASKASEWRSRDFFAVVNEHEPTAEANRTAGLMHRLLMLKQRHPMATDGVAEGGFDFTVERASMCAAETEIDRYEKAAPFGGMPYGLPGLSPDEHRLLTQWIERGAPFEGRGLLPALASARVQAWERFFNGDSLKERLFSRYAYEHLFLAHLYFDDVPDRPYFKLVRSRTPPGQPVDLIVSRRPVDDPGVARVYYRLLAERETIVVKTHMPYELSARRMSRWQALFLAPTYAVDRLPGYSAETAANPFLTFAALPVAARYRFMLDEAEFTIMGFIKGPVCRGQMALDVIEDHFWVTFLAPSDDYDMAVTELLRHEAPSLRLPSGRSNTDVVIAWARYAALESEYAKARTAFFERTLRGRHRLDLRLIWNGEGTNDNAALTVFRHYDSASVVKGLVGESPKTAWVIGYPLLERIHYLLVADYDVYGNIGHQLNSRLYMDFLRMEGEFHFLALLPQAQRSRVRDEWYRGVGQASREQVYGGPATTLNIESDIKYSTDDPKRELFGLLKSALAPVLSDRLDPSRVRSPELRASLAQLEAVRGRSLNWMPEVALLVVEMPDGTSSTSSLLRNTGHASVSHLIGESKELRPDENTLTVVPGVIASYPNAFYRAKAAEVPALADALGRLNSQSDYAVFAQRWAVRRTHPDFWVFSDAIHERFARDQGTEAGVLDYNRFENR